jgi:hypothetical protein
MRTTLTLEDDAAEMARRHALRRRISLGKAVSDLIRKGVRRPLVTVDRNGLKVARLSEGSPAVTSEQVAKLLDELP